MSAISKVAKKQQDAVKPSFYVGHKFILHRNCSLALSIRNAFSDCVFVFSCMYIRSS